MNAIDRVKELLAAAETECVKGNAIKQGGCPRCAARETLRDDAIPIAQALVEIQEALRALVPWLDGIKAKDAARAALRLDGLAKVMKR